ncbi:hypothetical protein GCM10027612_52910 [Microbispora bryophytorum subsp. camponoti]
MKEAERERPPGRPRSADIDAAILAAAVDLLIERGIDAVTIEQVARRAGVTRATVYRRFPDKIRLLVAAIGAGQDASPPPPEPVDIEQMLAIWARHLALPRLRKLTRRLMTSLHDYPALREAYWNASIRRREEAIRASLEHARDRGRFPLRRPRRHPDDSHRRGRHTPHHPARRHQRGRDPRLPAGRAPPDRLPQRRATGVTPGGPNGKDPR